METSTLERLLLSAYNQSSCSIVNLITHITTADLARAWIICMWGLSVVSCICISTCNKYHYGVGEAEESQ